MNVGEDFDKAWEQYVLEEKWDDDMDIEAFRNVAWDFYARGVTFACDRFDKALKKVVKHGQEQD